MSSPVSYDLQGQGGGIVLEAGNSTPAGVRYRWIQVINDAAFTDLASSNITDVTSLVGITVPAGIGIGGMFSDIDLLSGVVIAYLA